MFPTDYHRLCNSVLLVCSKVPASDNLRSVTGQMNKIIENYKDISNKAKKMMNTILNKKNVCVFPQPENFGE